MRKISKLLKSELKYAKNFFFHSHRGPLIGIILIVIAIPLTTLLVSNNNQKYQSTPTQIAENADEGGVDILVPGANIEHFDCENTVLGGHVCTPFSGSREHDYQCNGNNIYDKDNPSDSYPCQPTYTIGGKTYSVYCKTFDRFTTGAEGAACYYNLNSEVNNPIFSCTSDGDCGGQQTCSATTHTCVSPPSNSVPGCGAAPRQNQPAGQKDCAQGDIINHLNGAAVCSTPYSYTGYSGQKVCGSNKIGYICNGNTGVWDPNPEVPSCGPGSTTPTPVTNPTGTNPTPTTWAPGCNIAPRTGRTAGQYDCPWGDIINHSDGKPVCSTPYSFTGYADQPVCGSDKKGYICDGTTGLWKLNPAVPSCGPGSGACPDTWDSNGKPVIAAANGTKICGNSGSASDPKKYNYTCVSGTWSAAQGECAQQNTGCNCTGGSVKINGSVNNNYTAKCGDIVCGSDNHSYTCTYPGGDYTSYKYSNAQCAGTTPEPPGTNPTPTTGVGTPTPSPVPTTAIPTTAVNPTGITPTGVTPTGITPTGITPTGTGPTATSVPGSTNLVFFLTVDGIGTNTGIGQNNNPTPNIRTAGVQIIDSTGNKVFDSAGDLSYNSETGAFTGKVNVPNLTSGNYSVRTRFNNTLWKKIPRVLTAGQDNSLPSVKLINGDVNEDNKLNLLDYTIMISCFGDKQCSQKTISDLNSDGKVSDVDINILYYHFKNREGD